jgi:hypothetical protein
LEIGDLEDNVFLAEMQQKERRELRQKEKRELRQKESRDEKEAELFKVISVRPALRSV